MERASIWVALMAVAMGSLPSGMAHAAHASDDASDPVYDDGWDEGDAGGFGWATGWQEAGSGIGGWGIASSTTNGDGDDDGDGDIDTAGGRAFEIAAPADFAIQIAHRSFATPLAVGERIALDMDADLTADPAFVGFSLHSPGGERMRFDWVGESASYVVHDGGATVSLAIPYTDEGLHVEFLLTATNYYELRVQPLGGALVSRAGLLNVTGGVDDIDSIWLESWSGDATSHRHFFNAIAVPEPDARFAGAAALLASGALARRRARAVRPD